MEVTMKSGELFLKIAEDEAKTLADYQRMIDETELSEEEKGIVDEIMGDEFNHCLVALLSAAKILDIHIATDDISEDPNKIEVE